MYYIIILEVPDLGGGAVLAPGCRIYLGAPQYLKHLTMHRLIL